MMPFAFRATSFALCLAVLPTVALANNGNPPSSAPLAAVPTPAAADAMRFELLEFAVDGNTVLPDLAIEKAVYRYLGPGRDLRDVEAARAALEKAYQDEGWLSVSVFIPEQQIADGLVRLQVLEGSVEKLKVSGNQFSSRRDIREQVPALAAGEVPHFPAMQEQLAGLNRADRRVTPLLRPGKNPGKLEVELSVEDDLPLHGSIELNNKQSPNTTAQRLEAGLRYDNLFQKEHSFGLNLVQSPQKREEVDVLVANYSLPLGTGRTLSAYIQRSNSNIATVVAGAQLSKGTTTGLRLSLQLPGLASSPGFFHTLSLGADHKRFDDTQNAATLTGDSPLRYTPVVGQYTVGSSDDNGELIGNLIVSGGLRSKAERLVDCHGVVREQFECRRAGAQPNFAVLKGDLSLTKRLLGWELMGRGDFQTTGAPLLPGEQMLAGGADSVRGYLEGEVAGDIGWRLRAQLMTPSLFGSDYFSLRGVAFFDAAWLKRTGALPGEIAETHIAGSGLGLRVKAGKNLQLSVDWARAADAASTTPRGEQRVHVRLGASL